MFDKLEAVVAQFKELEHRLSDPALGTQPDKFRKLSQEHSALQEVVTAYQSYKSIKEDLAASKEMLSDSDPEMASFAKLEVRRLEEELPQLERSLQVLLLPKDPRDHKNILLEIRAGAGGDEASLFCGELFRMYQRFCERQPGWRFEIMSGSSSGAGGMKEVIASVSGGGVFSRLKYEGGVHRVQRVPATEAQGRVHTSTVTVAVLPEAEEVDIKIDPSDLRIDVFRSGGAGGQGVNTTDSAVRITHAPTGVVVVCQDERSQLKNKDKAMKILRSRILEAEEEKAHQAHADERRSMVGTGDRSERIRTYNFPQQRLTDHRIGYTSHQLGAIMEGKIEEFLDALQTHYQSELLKKQGLG